MSNDNHIKLDHLALRPFGDNDEDYQLFATGFDQSPVPTERPRDILQQARQEATDPRGFFSWLVSDSATTWEGPLGFKLQVFDQSVTQWFGTLVFYNLKKNVSSADMDLLFLDQHRDVQMMHEALMGGLHFAWGHGLHRIEYTPETRDTATIDLLEDVGFRFEGIRRHGGFIDGAWRDLSVYATTEGELAELG